MSEQPIPEVLNEPYEMSTQQATVIDSDGAHTLELTSFTLGYSPWIVLVVDSVSPGGAPNFAVKWGAMSQDAAQAAIRALAASLPDSDGAADDGA